MLLSTHKVSPQPGRGQTANPDLNLACHQTHGCPCIVGDFRTEVEMRSDIGYPTLRRCMVRCCWWVQSSKGRLLPAAEHPGSLNTPGRHVYLHLWSGWPGGASWNLSSFTYLFILKEAVYWNLKRGGH